MRPALALVAGVLLLVVAACSQQERGGYATQKSANPKGTLIAGDPFQHLIFRRGPLGDADQVNVYLEGDGLPWVTRTRIARDPTPRHPLALRLMAHDPGPSLYLGRPCYRGLADSPGCSPRLWTHGRYGEEVVRSMVAALRRAIGPSTDREITLIGYSGGGVLAMLIAARMEQVRTVVTVASNLDIDAWADLNGYSRLKGSLNPATQPPLPARIRQVHLVGGRDRRAPPTLAQTVVARQANARIWVIRDFDHTCCWERKWPEILVAVGNEDLGLGQISRQPQVVSTAAKGTSAVTRRSRYKVRCQIFAAKYGGRFSWACPPPVALVWFSELDSTPLSRGAAATPPVAPGGSQRSR